MNRVDEQHKELIKKILDHGVRKSDRTGVGTLSIFGHQMRFDMYDGFPLLTLRKIHIKSFIHEMLWFLGAFDEKWKKFDNTNIRYLIDNGVTFWSEWPYKYYMEQKSYLGDYPDFNLKEFEEKIKIDDDFAIKFGSIGPGYGEQWLNHGSLNLRDMLSDGKIKITKLDGINQIDYAIELLRNDPDSRRIIVDAWNPMRTEEILLPACHMMFQFYSQKMSMKQRKIEYEKWLKDTNNKDVENGIKYYKFPDRYLSLQLYIRSQDLYLGNPFNVAEYSLLLHMISQIVNMIPHEIIITMGDVHLYTNSIDAAKEIIKRESFPLPILKLNKNIKNIYDFRYEDVIIENYQSHPNIKVDVAV